MLKRRVACVSNFRELFLLFIALFQSRGFGYWVVLSDLKRMIIFEQIDKIELYP